MKTRALTLSKGAHKNLEKVHFDLPPHDWVWSPKIDRKKTLSEACAIAGISVSEFCLRSRKQPQCYRRFYVWFLLKLRGYSFPLIATMGSITDHTSILHGVWVMIAYFKTKPRFNELADQLQNHLENNLKNPAIIKDLAA